MSAVSLYELLGSRPDASASELRFDYERALASAHRSGAVRHIEELVAAYELLSDPARRRTYDTTGIPVPRERVPNTYGPAVPFRSVLPSLDQAPPAKRGRRSAALPNSGEVRRQRQAHQAQQRLSAGDYAGASRAARAADRLQKGVEGEALVGGLLDGLTAYGWVVLHDRRKSPTSPANLDHVVIGPPGVLVIDSKNWSGGRLRTDDYGMAIGQYRKDDALQAAKIDADMVRDLVRQIPPGAPVCGVLAFVQDLGLEAPVRHRDVFLLQRDQLWAWIWSLPPALSQEQVQVLGSALNGALPPRTTAANAARYRAPRATPRSTGRGRSGQASGLRPAVAGLALLGATVVLMPHSGPLFSWLGDRLASATTPHVTTPTPAPTPAAPAVRHAPPKK